MDNKQTNVIWESDVLQQHHAVIIKWISYTLAFPTHVVIIRVAGIWKAGHYTQMSSKTGTAIKFIQPQC